MSQKKDDGPDPKNFIYPNDDQEENDENYIACIGNKLDSHVKYVKYPVLGVGIIGLMILGKNTKIATKFTEVYQIPNRFISRNFRLQGKVHLINLNGLMYIEHIPIISLARFGLGSNVDAKNQLLPVKIAAVEPQGAGVRWLKEVLPPEKHVWFRLLALEPKEQQLECIITSKIGRYTYKCVNTEMVRRGLAVVPYMESFPKNRVYSQLIDDLIRAEIYAEKKGLGLWEGTRPRLSIFGKIKARVIAFKNFIFPPKEKNPEE